jgi:hypothetical protein
MIISRCCTLANYCGREDGTKIEWTAWTSVSIRSMTYTGDSPQDERDADQCNIGENGVYDLGCQAACSLLRVVEHFLHCLLKGLRTRLD